MGESEIEISFVCNILMSSDDLKIAKEQTLTSPPLSNIYPFIGILKSNELWDVLVALHTLFKNQVSISNA